jgi:hypothetical protein
MQHVINNELKGTCFLHLNKNISKENKAFEKTKLNCFKFLDFFFVLFLLLYYNCFFVVQDLHVEDNDVIWFPLIQFFNKN